MALLSGASPGLSLPESGGVGHLRVPTGCIFTEKCKPAPDGELVMTRARLPVRVVASPGPLASFGGRCANDYRDGGPCHVAHSKRIRGVHASGISGWVVLRASSSRSV
jgi:hypothetical protein